MKEIFTMWKYPKMVSLVALSAALYAAVLIPFKSFQIMPGIDIRIGTALVPVLGIFFGPAGAWGAAIGNLIGDFFGSVGIGSIFGFLGNFFFAFAAYKIWYSGKDNFPITNTPAKVGKYLVASLFGTLSLIAILCFGLSAVVASLPYKVLPPILILTNGIPPFVLGAALISLFAKRLDRWNLTFNNIMKPEDFTLKGKTNPLGLVLLLGGALISIAAGLYMGHVQGVDVGAKLIAAAGPPLIAYFLGLALIGIDAEEFKKIQSEDDEVEEQPTTI